jgi:signal transduction histidine kinase
MVFEKRLGRTFDVSVTPLRDASGALAGSVHVMHDITELKRTEETLRLARNQAEAGNRAKSEFLANMSHEIRTPLNGVIGMLQLMDMSPLNEEQRECLRAAQKSAARLSRLLSDILDLSRVEAGKLSVQDADFSVAGLRESLRELFGLAAEEKGLALEVSIDERVPPLLVGDETRLRQILFNLVGNAIKFTEKGRVRVEASALPAAGDNRQRVLFTVQDTGVGIAEDRLTDIFEPFVQAEGSFTRSFQGAGLGLSIVRRLVTLLRGGLTVDSAAGEGTTFYLSLPFALPGAPPAPAGPPTPLSGARSGLPPRILLAEDDEVSLLAAARLLEKSGYAVTTAKDGQEAVRLFAEQDFDLILMDVQMPIMDGLEAARSIRESGAARAGVPIIALTAYAMAGDREKFLAAGMDDYLAKPVQLDELTAAILRTLGE